MVVKDEDGQTSSDDEQIYAAIVRGQSCFLTNAGSISPPLDLPPKKLKYTASMTPVDPMWHSVEPSRFSRDTVNPIRRIVDAMAIKPNPEKPLISLHIGDPTISGILPTHTAITDAVIDAVRSGKCNGYGPAFGIAEARRAVAELVSCAEAPISADDVILTSGCSHALEMAIEVLASAGQNILIPAPGFPLYQTLSVPLQVVPRYYSLNPDKRWEVDLGHLESLIDRNTAAIVVNNPSNPTGAVYSREHLQAILKVADKYKVPIIADEIYGDMVYDGATFHPMATLEPKVPILTCDGISKRYLVPGWRLGWLIIHDQPKGTLDAVRECARKLSQKIVGPSALIQGALPAILRNTPAEFFEHTRQVLATNAKTVMDELEDVPGVQPLRSHGAMYMMLNLQMRCFPFSSELEFAKQLIAEESVYCLPGSIFSYPNALRLVITLPQAQLREACERLRAFCTRHFDATLAGDEGSDPDVYLTWHHSSRANGAARRSSLTTLFPILQRQRHQSEHQPPAARVGQRASAGRH